jgi:D-alanyl-D-alanine dipeptidase
MHKKYGFVINVLLAIMTLYAPVLMPNLVDIVKVNAHIRIDCVYATIRNFTGKQIYAKPVCFLCAPVAQALSAVQKDLEKEGLGLLVWDGYRPLSAQQRLWDACPYEPKEMYVAPPSKGGRHTRGTAVDLTLVRLADGELLDMGTFHDEFSKKAHYDCPDISQTAKNNRKKLRDVMIAYGFEPYAYEWWHFDYKGWRDYPILAIEFELLI